MNARPDLYRHVHKGLRAAMFDTVRRIGLADTDDADELRHALDQAQRLLALLAAHLKHENEVVHCAIEARHPGGARRTADDHRGHLDALQALADDVARLRAAAPTDRAALAHRLYRHLAAFVAGQLEHMQREETLDNEQLWALYDDSELEALHDRLLESIAPHTTLETLHWMAQALAPQELAALLAGMQRKAPPEAFAAVLGCLRAQLGEQRWMHLARALRLPA